LNKREVIESGMLESYVLGTATVEESAMIQKLCKEHPELLKEVEQIEESLINFSERLSPPLNKDLKNKIASQLEFKEEKNSSAKIVPLQNDNKLRLYKFGMAASLLLFATSFIYNILLNRQLGRVNSELAQLDAARSIMAEEMKVQQASLKEIGSELQVVAHPMVKTIALRGMKSMDNHSAMVHWNTETEEVYFNAQALPKSPENMQYQLWAIVDGKPVDAGMIDMSDAGNVFKKMKSVKGAQAFAVTIEKMGGSPVPTMDTMCLLGNV
jgi:anti-sigma-K factor RskA